MLILASSSPRRRALLAALGFDFKVISASVDENPRDEEPPIDYVLRIAVEKATAIARKCVPEDIVIAADTLVVLDDRFLGKPSSPEEAVAMLKSLRGRPHQVYSGLAVLGGGDGQSLIDWCTTEVMMRDYSDEEIWSYVRSGDPLDKAGAYAIQHRGFNPVEKLVGCYTNVVGLPLCHLVRLLDHFQLSPPNDITQGCRSQDRYHCQLTHLVLEVSNASPWSG